MDEVDKMQRIVRILLRNSIALMDFKRDDFWAEYVEGSGAREPYNAIKEVNLKRFIWFFYDNRRKLFYKCIALPFHLEEGFAFGTIMQEDFISTLHNDFLDYVTNRSVTPLHAALGAQDQPDHVASDGWTFI